VRTCPQNESEHCFNRGVGCSEDLARTHEDGPTDRAATLLPTPRTCPASGAPVEGTREPRALLPLVEERAATGATEQGACELHL